MAYSSQFYPLNTALAEPHCYAQMTVLSQFGSIS